MTASEEKCWQCFLSLLETKIQSLVVSNYSLLYVTTNHAFEKQETFKKYDFFSIHFQLVFMLKHTLFVMSFSQSLCKKMRGGMSDQSLLLVIEHLTVTYFSDI